MKEIILKSNRVIKNIPQECTKENPCNDIGSWIHKDYEILDSDDVYGEWYRCLICGRIFCETIYDD